LGRRVAPHEHALFSAFSPDSKWISYSWLNAERRYELRIASVETLAERTILVNEGDGQVQPCAFTPESKQILTILIRRGAPEISFVDVEAGAVKTAKRLSGPPPKRLDLSPDGRWIAYGNRLLAADGSSERQLVQGLDDDLMPVFSPDGRAVFVLGKEGGLWRVGLDDGKPVRIQEGIGRAHLQGVTRTGLLYFGRLVGTGNVYRAGFDAVAGKLTTDVEAVGESEPQAALAMVAGRYRARGKELWREGGEAPVATFPRAITAVAVARDGETVAVAQVTTLTVLSPKGRWESRAASETISGLAWTADGRHLIAVQNDSLWWWSASLEEFRRLLKVSGGIGSVSLEPGDRTILFTAGRARSEVWSLPVALR